MVIIILLYVHLPVLYTCLGSVDNTLKNELFALLSDKYLF